MTSNTDKKIEEFMKQFTKDREDSTGFLLNNFERIMREVITELVLTKLDKPKKESVKTKKVSSKNDDKQKCAEKTTKGKPCSRYAVNEGLCKQHFDKVNSVSNDIKPKKNKMVKPKEIPKKVIKDNLSNEIEDDEIESEEIESDEEDITSSSDEVSDV